MLCMEAKENKRLLWKTNIIMNATHSSFLLDFIAEQM